MITKIKGLIPKVEDLLRKHKELRDDDNRLYICICMLSDKVLSTSGATFLHFGTQLVKGAYPPLESITRARRKVQELNPELRGVNYGKRKNRAVEVQNGINK